MRICPRCHQKFDAPDWHCPDCHAEPETRGETPILAPSALQEGSGYDPRFFGELYALEAGNWWFRARNRLILTALTRHFPGMTDFLEVGCGTGFVLQAVAAKFPGVRIVGTELFPEGLEFARSRVPSAEFCQMDATDIPFQQHFDVIGAFDVIEHIRDDELVLSQMHDALKPGGGLVLTVPQHAWLWSEQDVQACHERRYSRQELIQKLREAGFRVEWFTSFVSALLPLMWMSRRRRKPGTDFDPLAELRISPLTNGILSMIMNVERALIGAGLSLPWGGSLLVVARR